MAGASVSLPSPDGSPWVRRRRQFAPLSSIVQKSGLCDSGCCSTAEQATSSPRLRVAVIAFVSSTGEPEHDHWGDSFGGLLERQLAEVHAVRVIPASAVEVA